MCVDICIDVYCIRMNTNADVCSHLYGRGCACNVHVHIFEAKHFSPRFGELTSAELLLEMGDCEFSGEASLVRAHTPS